MRRLWPLALLCACEVERVPFAHVVVRPASQEALVASHRATIKRQVWELEMVFMEIKRDQLHIDTSLVFCERVAFGRFEFAEGFGRYFCVRGNEVLWDTEIGLAFDPLRMRDALKDPRAPKIAKTPLPPWASYRP